MNNILGNLAIIQSLNIMHYFCANSRMTFITYLMNVIIHIWMTNVSLRIIKQWYPTFNNSHHIMIDIIVYITYIYTGLLNVFNISYLNLLALTFTSSIHSSYISYNLFDAELLEYNNYIDFYNCNVLCFLLISFIQHAFMMFFYKYYEITKFSLQFISIFLNSEIYYYFIQPNTEYNNLKVNWFFLSEAICNLITLNIQNLK